MADVERPKNAHGDYSERPAACDAGKQCGLVSSWTKEHCDHVLDSIDAQLSQWKNPGVQVLSSSRDHNVSSDTSFDASWPAELEEHCVTKNEASQSSSSSVCTEDFAARFQEGMVEPLLFSEDEEDEPFLVWSRHASDIPKGENGTSCPTEDHDTGQDESLISTGRRQDVPWQLEVQLGCPLQSTSPSLRRRQSLESLGGRISRLSQSKAMTADTEPISSPGWRTPTAAPSAQRWTPHGASVRTYSTRRRAGVPLPQASISADSSFPGNIGTGTRWHRMSKPMMTRQQEPPASWSQSEAAIALAITDVDVEGAGERFRRAQSWAHGTQAAARPHWTHSSDSSGDHGAVNSYNEPSSCEGSHWRSSSAERWTWSRGKGAKPCSQHGRLEASLDHKVQSRLLEDGKTWWAEKKGNIQSQRGILQEQSQRAFPACQEGLEKKLRKTSALQEEKLELQKRLHKLEHCTRNLLQQRKEALDKLHLLLKKEKMYMLWQLQETLEQERACDSTWLQRLEQQHLLRFPHRETSLQESAVPGQAGRSLARHITLACQRLHDLLPDRSMGQSSSPALFGSSRLSSSHAFRVLHGLSEETQCPLRDMQQERGPQRHSALHLRREKECELRQLRERMCMEEEAGPRALKEKLIQRQSKYPHVCSASSLSSSTVPCLRQPNVRPLGILHPIQNCMQELQAKTTSTGNLENPTGLEGGCT